MYLVEVCCIELVAWSERGVPRLFPSLVYILPVVRVSILAQSSYHRMTYKSSIRGGNKLDVVIWHSCTMLTWRFMELYCTDAPVLLLFG